ncbi:hypothetical protein NQ318_001953 [Aromia moschata]|uniref:Uncharacterized protein n=1 Tax=Aromia moschata TaxID=1265417 RepID=A0AAV8Z3U9_9CUCU|nr:hypothetical protein NQ318_001953 [Aromia moschata]
MLKMGLTISHFQVSDKLVPRRYLNRTIVARGYPALYTPIEGSRIYEKPPAREVEPPRILVAFLGVLRQHRLSAALVSRRQNRQGRTGPAFVTKHSSSERHCYVAERRYVYRVIRGEWKIAKSDAGEARFTTYCSVLKYCYERWASPPLPVLTPADQSSR